MVNMIASWGSNGAGKTTVALALAAALSDKGKNAIVVSNSTSPPMLPVYLPKGTYASTNSVGNLLAAETISYATLRGYIHLHPESQRIGFMAMAGGETPIDYNAVPDDKVRSLLQALDGTPFDYIIFDLETNPATDPLAMLALRTADVVLRTITPDVRGIEFERSQVNWLENVPDMRWDQQIRILNPIYPVSPDGEVEAVTGKADYLLPFSRYVYDAQLSGALMQGGSDRGGLHFKKQIHKLCRYILEERRDEVNG